MKNQQQERLQEYHDRKFYVIAEAFAFILAGISWLSLEVASIQYLTRPVGIGFLATALFLIAASWCSRGLSKGESFLKRIRPVVFPIIATSLMAGLYQASEHITHDWRFLTLSVVVFMFMSLVIISLVIILAARCRSCRLSSPIHTKAKAVGSTSKRLGLRVRHCWRKGIGWMEKGYKWTWFVSAVIMILFVGSVWYFGFPSLPEENAAMLYLLSGIGQALAAVFALVFAISLIATQLTARYTYSSLEKAFSPFTVGYIILFVAAIIYPFFLLSREFSLIEVRASLCVAAACIVLLVPYFTTFPTQLGIKRAISSLRKESTKQFVKGDVASAAASSIEIENIAMNAAQSGDYQTFDFAVKSLGDVVVNASNSSLDTTWVLQRFNFMASKHMADSKAIISIILTLKLAAIEAIQRKERENNQLVSRPDWSLLSECTSIMHMIGSQAAVNRDELVIRSVLICLSEIAERAIAEKSAHSLSATVASYLLVMAFIGDSGVVDRMQAVLVRFIIVCSRARASGLLDRDTENRLYGCLAQIDNRQKTEYADSIFDTARKMSDGDLGDIVRELRKEYEDWKK